MYHYFYSNITIYINIIGKRKGEWQWLTGLILTDINDLSFRSVNLQRVNY